MTRHTLILTFCAVLAAVAACPAQTVTPWLTTGDRQHLLERRDAIQFGHFFPTGAQVEIDADAPRQTVDGFGFTLTEGSAEALLSLPKAKRSALLNEIFNPYIGLGSAVVRIGIGATDLSRHVYSYNDTPGDTQLAHFSLDGPDKRHLLPVLKEILAINPDIKVLATPWSAPAWMKSPRSNTLDASFYGVYARYLVKYLQAMRDNGVRVWAITPQNEPGNPYNQPSMGMSATEQLTFINYHLGPALRKAGFGHVRLICYDHNCDNVAFPVFVSKYSDYVDGAAFHLYAGDISALGEYHRATGKNVYFTEQYTDAGGDFRDDFLWHVREVMIGSMNHYARIALEWNLASYGDFTPHTPGGCSRCLGAITCHRQGGVSRNVPYYTVGQFSKFIRPGAERLECRAEGVHAAAFRNTDGSMALAVLNDRNDDSATVTVHCGGQRFSYSLPPASAVTFVWDGVAFAPSFAGPATALRPSDTSWR